MDNETDMAILFVSHENESFALLKFDKIPICQNQKLQIPIFMVYKTPDVQLTKIKYDSFVLAICHEIPWQPFNPDSYFCRHLRYCTLWAKL